MFSKSERNPNTSSMDLLIMTVFSKLATRRSLPPEHAESLSAFTGPAGVQGHAMPGRVAPSFAGKRGSRHIRS
jgi:hypothetical protein